LGKKAGCEILIMGEDIPRRLRRFHRKGQEQEALGSIDIGQDEQGRLAETISRQASLKKGAEGSSEITRQLAIEEVEKFKQKHKRRPSRQELGQIAESIYAQLKDKEQRKKIVERLDKMDREKEKHGKKGKSKRHRGRPLPGGKVKGKDFGKAGGKPVSGTGLDTSEVKALKVEDLFGESEKGKGKPGENPLDEKPGQGTELGKGKEGEFSLNELKGVGESQEEAKNKCPKCGKETLETVFCPECGAAFCENCAKNVKSLGKAKTFICPECNAKVKK